MWILWNAFQFKGTARTPRTQPEVLRKAAASEETWRHPSSRSLLSVSSRAIPWSNFRRCRRLSVLSRSGRQAFNRTDDTDGTDTKNIVRPHRMLFRVRLLKQLVKKTSCYGFVLQRAQRKPRDIVQHASLPSSSSVGRVSLWFKTSRRSFSALAVPRTPGYNRGRLIVCPAFARVTRNHVCAVC